MTPSHRAEVKDFQFTQTSTESGRGGSVGGASFYKADLDRVQRKLNGIQVQMYVHPRCIVNVRVSYGPLIIRFAVSVPPIPSLEISDA
jgi:hypothetical protein